MKKSNYRWVNLLILIALISCIPLGIASATLGEPFLDDPNPINQSDPRIEATRNPGLYLILGALVIVLVILGAVLLRRPKL